MADELAQLDDQTPPEEPKKMGFFARMRERRKLWKADKRRWRAAEKERYRNAPLHIKVWNLYLRRPVTALAIIVLVVYVFYPVALDLAQDVMNLGIGTAYDARNEPVSKDEIYELSPIDEEGAARIDALESVDAKDTWTICVYIVGSDLEDDGENDLSATTILQVQDQIMQGILPERVTYGESIAALSEELQANGLGLPDYLYYPAKPSGEAPEPANPNYVTDREGSASMDIVEMTSGTWSDNIDIVVQTGGATHWSHPMVNPNRTQRFQYKGGVFKEIENLPLEPCSTVQTLADFLAFCRDKHPADHTMLILWDHGSGAFGYGNDAIYGSMLTLKEIREALSSVYEPNQSDPAFDIIGFDACLMSSLEVTHALDGFASYYVVSEETEPGDGWDYVPWLQAMTDDPTMSPARVAREIADTYIDYYMTQNVNIGHLMKHDLNFEVLDAKKASELYDAYCELTKAQLVDATQDLSILAAMGRRAYKSTHFFGAVYDTYNTIDLGNYVDLMIDLYPEQSSRVKDLIGETVLYHRGNGSLSEAQGISVYLPGTVHTDVGLKYALDYINDVCEDEATKALYYYKVAGSLNDEFGQYARTLVDAEPKKLDTKPFKDFCKVDPVLEGEYFTIDTSENLREMLQSYLFEFALVDEEDQKTICYGKDEYLTFESEGVLNVDFAGEWVYLDSLPLAIEVVSATESYVTYRSKISVNGETKYLEFTFDRDTEQFSILGARDVESSMFGGDTPYINVFANTRTLNELPEGAEIKPIYEVVDGVSQVTSEEESEDSVVFGKGTEVTLRGLDSGYYIGSAVITDIRGDEYYSPVMGYTISGGKVTDRKLDPDYMGSSY